MRPIDAEAVLCETISTLGVALSDFPGGTFVGPGADALVAWEAFKRVAAIPADDEFPIYDTTARADRAHDGDLLIFETGMAPPVYEKGWGWARDPRDDVAEGFAAYFSRQFGFEDAADEYEYIGMNALHLRIEYPASEGLIAVAGERIVGCGGPPWADDEPKPPSILERGMVEGIVAAAEWIAQVEASPAFSRLTETTADRFFISQSDI